MAAPETQAPVVLQLKPTMEALGIVLSFICRSAPYDDFRAAKIIRAIEHQLASRCHVCLIRDEQLIAYAGWLPIDADDGDKWLEGNGTLTPASSPNKNAAALTVVSSLSPSHLPQLIRACRTLAPRRTIYFKRDYKGQRTKKSKVFNRT